MEVDSFLVLRLLGALRDCSRHVERGVREHPLDVVDVGLLVLAEETGGELRPSQAAERLKVPAPSITRHVRNLQNAGHLSVEPDTDDLRSYRIAITAAGRAMLSDFHHDLISRFAPVLDGWSPEEVRVLANGLSRLNQAMTTALENRARQADTVSWWRARTSSPDEHTTRRKPQ